MAVDFLETFDTNPLCGPLGTGDAFPDFAWFDVAANSRFLVCASAMGIAGAGGVLIPSDPLFTYGLCRYVCLEPPAVEPVETGFTILMDGDDFQGNPPQTQTWGVMNRTTIGSDSFYFSGIERRSGASAGTVHYILQKYVNGVLDYNETYHSEVLQPGIIYERHVQSRVEIAGSGVNYLARVFTGWLDVATIKVSTLKSDSSGTKIDHGGANLTGLFCVLGQDASAQSEIVQFFVGNNLFGTTEIPDLITLEQEAGAVASSLPYQGIRLQNKFNLKI